MDEEKKLGIKAIQYLQSLAGITETENEANRGWDSMTEAEKEQTIKVFKQFGGQ